MSLLNLLENNNIPFKTYIKLVIDKILDFGLDPKKLKLADDKKHKFDYDGIKFGSSINKDFLIYTILENMGEIDKGTANKKRNSYRARAKQIYEKSKKLSPSALSYNILW
jgi:hypothetical protein